MKAFTEQMLCKRWPRDIANWQQCIEFNAWASGFLIGCLEGGASPDVMDDIEMLADMLIGIQREQVAA